MWRLRMTVFGAERKPGCYLACFRFAPDSGRSMHQGRTAGSDPEGDARLARCPLRLMKAVLQGRNRAKQMGTSVKMIEDHYGHIRPVKNADRILLDLPGWQSGQPEMAAG